MYSILNLWVQFSSISLSSFTCLVYCTVSVVVVISVFFFGFFCVTVIFLYCVTSSGRMPDE